MVLERSEIESSDGIAMANTGAWHGLGTVVDHAMSVEEALELAGLNRKVIGLPLEATLPDGSKFPVPGWVMNAYEDRPKHNLGIVGDGYKPIQNSELAEFCQALAKNGDKVQVETAGSIRHGAKVWFLLRGESFSVRKEDEIRPYVCVANGHDGWTAMRATFTNVRVVCSNTLHMVIPKRFAGGALGAVDTLKTPSFVLNHTTNVMKRLEEARAALGLYQTALDDTRELMDALAAKEIGREGFEAFFLNAYTAEFGAIPKNPKDKKEENSRDRATAAYRAMQKRFEDEKVLAGATLWNAFNAFTGWVQNDRETGVLTPAKAERRAHSKLFGADAERADAAFLLAVKSLS
jgi:phage/plasmid-like protein (TIGR03299 family)